MLIGFYNRARAESPKEGVQATLERVDSLAKCGRGAPDFLKFFYVQSCCCIVRVSYLPTPE